MSVSAARWRELACSLPEVEEKSHFGQPDFRVRGKIFAGLSQDEKRGTLKLPRELQTMLLEAKPQAFSPAAGAWGDKGWTHVTLAKLEAGAAPELLREAWRQVAPKKLLDSAQPPAAKPKPRKSAKRRR